MKKITYYKELVYLSFPILLSSLATTLINIASVPILGNYGVDDMAASATATSIVMILNNVLLASYTGFRILGSKAYGANNQNDINTYTGNSFILGLIISITLAAIMLLLGKDIINIMSQEEYIQTLAFKILKIDALAFPINAITSILLIKFSLEKKTKYSFYIMLISNIIGIILSVILVYGYKTIVPYGAIGAAWAGVTQNILACFICLWITVQNIIRPKFTFKMAYIKKLLNLSYPMMISMFIDYLGNFIMFSMIGFYLGKEALAASRLCFSLLLFSFSLITAFASGFMILGGRALGEANNSKFIIYYRCNRNILLGLAFILSLLVFAIPSHLLGLLTAFKTVQDIAITPIIIITLICPFIAISYSNASCLRLMEKVKEDMYCNMGSLWIVQLPLGYYLGIYCQLGVNGFFISLLAYELIYSISTYYCLHTHIKT